MIVITEPSFDFILGRDGRLMLVILARPHNPRDPFFVSDRGSGLALFRDKGEILELNSIPGKVLRVARRSKDISVLEMDTLGKPARQYNARVVLDGGLRRKLKCERKLPVM